MIGALPAKKSLGQHFLTNPEICARVASLLDLSPRDNVLEIGPGPGALTRALLAAPRRRLLVVEKDARWAERWQSAPGVELAGRDALEFDWRGLCGEGAWKLAGNLPYNVASPLIWEIVSQCRCYERAVFMVQLEVGERLRAKPDSRKYGALSVWAQSFADVALKLRLKPGAFSPAPKVDSAVMLFTPLADRPAHPDFLKRVLAVCFQQRRKQLGGVFRRAGLAVLSRGLAELGMDPDSRPENIPPAQFVALADFWAKAA